MNERAYIVVSGPTLFEMKQDCSPSLVEGVLAQSDVGNLLDAIAHEVRLRGIHPAHSDSLDRRCVQSISLLFGPGLVSSYGSSLFSFRVYGRGKLSIFFFSSLFEYTIEISSQVDEKTSLSQCRSLLHLFFVLYCGGLMVHEPYETWNT